MKHRFLLSVIAVILLTFILANIVYDRYQNTYVEDSNFYYLQQGVYTDQKSIDNIAASYITIQEEDKYYTYLGMTTDREIAEKIKKMYEKEGIPVYIKGGKTSNQEFLTELEQYDVLLKATEDYQETKTILETILSTYEETVQEDT